MQMHYLLNTLYDSEKWHSYLGSIHCTLIDVITVFERFEVINTKQYLSTWKYTLQYLSSEGVGSEDGEHADFFFKWWFD